jgi:hypothetical protein
MSAILNLRRLPRVLIKVKIFPCDPVPGEGASTSTVFIKAEKKQVIARLTMQSRIHHQSLEIHVGSLRREFAGPEFLLYHQRFGPLTFVT